MRDHGPLSQPRAPVAMARRADRRRRGVDREAIRRPLPSRCTPKRREGRGMGAMKWWGWGEEDVTFTHEGKPDLGPFLARAIDVDVAAPAARPVGFDDLEVPEPALDADLRAALE